MLQMTGGRGIRKALSRRLFGRSSGSGSNSRDNDDNDEQPNRVLVPNDHETASTDDDHRESTEGDDDSSRNQEIDADELADHDPPQIRLHIRVFNGKYVIPLCLLFKYHAYIYMCNTLLILQVTSLE